MKLLLELPDEFAQHFAMDRFKDSFMRICGDLGEIAKLQSRRGAISMGLSGNYERELADALAEAFAGASVTESPKRVRQVLQAERRLAFTEVQFWDTIVQGFPHNKDRRFNRLHELNYSLSCKGRTPQEWLEYWLNRAERVSKWLREFRPGRRSSKCK